MTPDPLPTPDAIAEAAVPRLAGALDRRAKVMAMTVAARRAAIAPNDPGGLAVPLRVALARRVAVLTGEEGLAEACAGQFADAGRGADDATAGLAGDARTAALLRHVDLVARRPQDASAADIDALRSAGWAEADIVRLSQLIAFVAFEARLVAGLRAMRGPT